MNLQPSTGCRKVFIAATEIVKPKRSEIIMLKTKFGESV